MKKHVGVLEQAGLVTTEKVGRVRICKFGLLGLEEEGACIESQYAEIRESRSSTMSLRQPVQVRFPFHSQLPRDDGCGVRVLQMLTGMTYDQVAAMVDWGDRSVHYTRWDDVCRVLRSLGWSIGTPIRTSDWSDIQGVAVVHVDGDHFLLYDSVNRLFYDPGEPEGPAVVTSHTPTSYLTVQPGNVRRIDEMATSG